MRLTLLRSNLLSSVPLEQSEIRAREDMIEEQIKKEFSVDIIDRTEQANPKLIKRLNKLQKTKGCQWSPIEFDVTGSLTYLLSRSAAEFASLVSSKKEYTIL